MTDLEFQLSDADLERLPPSALRLIIRQQLAHIAQQDQRIKVLEAKVNSDSEAGTPGPPSRRGNEFTVHLPTGGGGDPTNNFGERMLRYAVLWRKRSQGTSSVKGNRWMERIIFLRQTCRLHGKSSFHVPVGAMNSNYKEREPDLEWIRSAA